MTNGFIFGLERGQPVVDVEVVLYLACDDWSVCPTIRCGSSENVSADRRGANRAEDLDIHLKHGRRISCARFAPVETKGRPVCWPYSNLVKHLDNVGAESDAIFAEAKKNADQISQHVRSFQQRSVKGGTTMNGRRVKYRAAFVRFVWI